MGIFAAADGGSMGIRSRSHRGSVPVALVSGLGLATAVTGALAAPAGAVGNACTAADSGSVMVSGGVCERTFAATGTTHWKVPAGVTSIDVLTVGGGGGGGGAATGYAAGGGGGGGQVTYCRESVAAADSLSIEVGAGGGGGAIAGSPSAAAGGTTQISDATHHWGSACLSAGGGAGLPGQNTGGSIILSSGADGPSGAGGASGTNAGGLAGTTTVLGAGGGAGAGAAGASAAETAAITISGVTHSVDRANAGAGGAGRTVVSGLFAGNTTAYGGGGGGGASASLFDFNSGTGFGTRGSGTAGGGEGAGLIGTPTSGYFVNTDCTPIIAPATAGAAHTGGGGGGGTNLGCNGSPYIFHSPGAAGGSGVVLIRWGFNGSTAFTIPQNSSHHTNAFASAVGGFVPTSAHVSTPPTHGTVTKTTASDFKYQPNADYYGNDSYQITLVNAAGATQLITVNITITHVLPTTGAEGVIPLSLTGATLLLAGAVLIATTRRRTTS